MPQNFSVHVRIMRCAAIIGASLALIASATQAQAQAPYVPQFENLTRACLPEAGRMSPDRAEPCHCPPESMCPETKEEWDAGEKLPSVIQNVCCKRPYDCTVELISHVGTVCGSYYTTGPELYSFCMEYKPEPVNPAPANPASDPETQRRKQAANQLNTCLRTQCADLIDRVKREAPEGFDPPLSTDYNLDNKFSQNFETFREFINCEYQCRKEAADKLGLPLNSQTHSMESYLGDISDWMPSMYDSGPSLVKTVLAPRRLIEFTQYVYGTEWVEADEVRRQRAIEFATENPAPLPLQFSGLESKLSCTRNKEGSICYGAILNNGSCGSCLVKGTKVLMADGSEREIQLINPGEKVKTDQGEATVVRQVALVWPTVAIYSINGGALELTGDHPVMTTKGWRAIDYETNRQKAVEKYGLEDVAKLAVGDVLITRGGKIEITSIVAGESQTNYQTFNLKLKGGGAFYANGVLVKSN